MPFISSMLATRLEGPRERIALMSSIGCAGDLARAVFRCVGVQLRRSRSWPGRSGSRCLTTPSSMPKWILDSRTAFSLAARLNISLPGLERSVAQDLVDAAHRTCPYSKAVRGNIDVALNLVS